MKQFQIYSYESNSDEFEEKFVRWTYDWKSYLCENGLFLGINKKFSRIDYFVFEENKLVFDTKKGYSEYGLKTVK